MKHDLMKPSDEHYCAARDDVPGSCWLCDGGLALCKTCGGVEGELTTDCPGVKTTYWVRQQVMRGHLDFVGGRWQELYWKSWVRVAVEDGPNAVEQAIVAECLPMWEKGATWQRVTVFKMDHVWLCLEAWVVRPADEGPEPQASEVPR